MKNVQTVSIGIPAYNEGKNIQRLLKALLAQKESGIKLKEIIIVSDGSSDDTEQKVKSLKDKKILYKEDHKRLGKSARLDQIFRTFKSDVLLLVDADIMINDTYLISKTVKQANLTKTGIAGVNALPLNAETFFERIVEAGVMVMKDVAGDWNKGNNYLSYKGCFLALDGKLARSIHMPQSIVNNDAFLYFSAIQAGYSPAYLEESRVYYRSPMTLADHMKQSSRYQSSEGELRKHFDLDWDQQYTIPRGIMVKSLAKSLLMRPVTTLSYLGVYFYSKVKKQTTVKSTWSIATSTKGKIVYDQG